MNRYEKYGLFDLFEGTILKIIKVIFLNNVKFDE